MTTMTIICATCHAPIEGPVNPRPSDRYTCSVCGQGDRFAAVEEEAKDYVVEMAARKLQDVIFSSYKKPFSYPVILKKPPAVRQWRFIVEGHV